MPSCKSNRCRQGRIPCPTKVQRQSRIDRKMEIIVTAAVIVGGLLLGSVLAWIF